VRALILPEQRALFCGNVGVSGFGNCFGVHFRCFFASRNAIGEAERERKALSGEAFRGSEGGPAWFRASTAPKGEAFRDYRRGLEPGMGGRNRGTR
jgi:hypothetical protein